MLLAESLHRLVVLPPCLTELLLAEHPVPIHLHGLCQCCKRETPVASSPQLWYALGRVFYCVGHPAYTQPSCRRDRNRRHSREPQVWCNDRVYTLFDHDSDVRRKTASQRYAP